MFVGLDTEIKNQILITTKSSRLRRYTIQHDLDVQGILKQGRLFEEAKHNVSIIKQKSGSPTKTKERCSQ